MCREEDKEEVVEESPDVVRPASSPSTAMGALWTAPVVPELNAVVARGLRSKAAPVETLRRSDRRDGGSEGLMMDKATRRLEEKCNSAAKKNPKGTNLDPIFAILQDIPDAHFLSVASDSCVLFPSSEGQAAEALTLIRANELAQAV